MKKFIAGAIKHPGALRRTAAHEHLLAGEHDTLSYGDLVKLKNSPNKKVAQRARFALELRGFRHHAAD